MVNLCMKNFPILIRSFVSSCRFQIKPGCSLFFLNNVVPDLNLPIPFLHWGIEMTNRFIWMAATKNFVFLKYFVVLSNSSKKVIKKDVYLAVRRSGPFLTFFFYFLFLRIKKHGEVQERHWTERIENGCRHSKLLAHCITKRKGKRQKKEGEEQSHRTGEDVILRLKDYLDFFTARWQHIIIEAKPLPCLSFTRQYVFPLRTDQTAILLPS